MEWSEGGGKWDNCNSIINKFILKKEILGVQSAERFSNRDITTPMLFSLGHARKKEKPLP